MICKLKFSQDHAEKRFLAWVAKGNKKSESLGTSSLGLQARILKVGVGEYVFFWEHIFILNMSLFLKSMLWLQLRKVRKGVKVIPLGKLELVDLLLSRGLKS